MTDFGFKIDESQIKNLVAEGLLAQLTGDTRNEILRQAVVYLLTPQKADYGRQVPSPLQLAFNAASERVMRDIVEEVISDDEDFKAKIREATTEAISAAMNDGSTFGRNISRAMADVIQQGWSERRFHGDDE